MIGKVQKVTPRVSQIEISFKGTAKTRSTERPAGLDSLPVEGDLVNLRADDSYEKGTIQKPSVNPGEIKVFARAESGAEVATIHLKNDGTITVSSQQDISINGATITATGDVISSTGVSLSNHVHPYTDSGSPAITGGPK